MNDRMLPAARENGRESMPFEVPSLEALRLRASLRQLAEPRAFLAGAEGIAFLRQLECRLVPPVRAAARRLGLGGDWAQPQEVVNMLIVRLCADEASVALRIAETALDPWAYLSRCSMKWAGELWGARGASLDQALELHPGCVADVSHEPAQNEELTTLDEVVALTHRALVLHTPGRLKDPLFGLLAWLANNPPQRVSHESADRVAAARAFPQFTEAQLIAVANISWGGRPRRRETSFLAAFLLNPEFRPSDSPTHARALLHYRRSMRSQQSLVTQFERFAA